MVELAPKLGHYVYDGRLGPAGVTIPLYKIVTLLLYVDQDISDYDGKGIARGIKEALSLPAAQCVNVTGPYPVCLHCVESAEDDYTDDDYAPIMRIWEILEDGQHYSFVRSKDRAQEVVSMYYRHPDDCQGGPYVDWTFVEHEVK